MKTNKLVVFAVFASALLGGLVQAKADINHQQVATLFQQAANKFTGKAECTQSVDHTNASIICVSWEGIKVSFSYLKNSGLVTTTRIETPAKATLRLLTGANFYRFMKTDLDKVLLQVHAPFFSSSESDMKYMYIVDMSNTISYVTSPALQFSGSREGIIGSDFNQNGIRYQTGTLKEEKVLNSNGKLEKTILELRLDAIDVG